MSKKTYLIRSFRVNSSQFNFFNDLFSKHKLTHHEILAFKQVFAYSYSVLNDVRLLCPLSKQFRRDHFGGVDLLRLCHKKEDMLIYRNHSHYHHRCRCYGFQPWVINKFESLADADTEIINWMTGKPRRRTPAKTPLYTSALKPYPKLVHDAIEVFHRVPKIYNHGRVVEEIKVLQDSGDPRKMRRADLGRRFLHNVPLQEVPDNNSLPASLQELVSQKGFKAYFPIYNVINSGRMYEANSGTQNLPKELKRAAFSHPDIHNYDIKSCHPNILRQLLEDFNDAYPSERFDIAWLADYLDNPCRRDQYANQIGISVGCWKRCFLALFYGAAVRHPPKKWAARLHEGSMDSLEPSLLEWEDVALSRPSYSIFEAIWSDLADGQTCEHKLYDGAVERILRFRKAIRGFDNQMHRLRRILSAKNMGRRKFSSLFRFTATAFTVTNLSGMKMSLLPDSANESKEEDFGKHILCHILQGAESAYIHKLTALGDKFGYFPLGNEHDGLIVFGIIPPEASSSVQEDLRLKHVVLEEKPF